MTRQRAEAMSDAVIPCPACKKLLRSTKPVPAGATLRCPECRAGFSAPVPRGSPPSVSLFGPAFVIAVAVAVILGGSAVTVALLLSGPRGKPQEPVAKDDAEARKLAEEREKLERSRKEMGEEKKKFDVAKLVLKGQSALDANNYADAEKAFTEAFDLTPSEPAVMKGLIAARAGLEAAKKTGDDTKKRDADRDRLLADGRQAIADKKFAEAVRLLEAARGVAPTDAAVLTALSEARAALDGDETQKKRLAEYTKQLAAGKTLLEAGKYTDAIREFAGALAVMPDSAEAKDGQKAAEAKLAALGDAERTNKAFEAALDRARRAGDERRYAEAVATLEGAMRLIPDDKEGTRRLRAAREALDKVKASNARLLEAAKTAVAAGQLDEAVNLANRAVLAWAEDEKAKKLYREADRLLETARTNAIAYQQYLNTGVIAMNTRQYGDAVAAFTEALKIQPGNLELQIQLRNAKIAYDGYLRSRVEYERLIRVGTQALRANAFAEARKTFEAAQRLMPDDLAAPKGASDARYGQAMTDGTQALRLKKKADALAAFNAALAERVGDIAANRGLAEAMRLK